MTLMTWMQKSGWRSTMKKREPESIACHHCGGGQTYKSNSTLESIAGPACLIVLMAISVPFSLGLWHWIEQKSGNPSHSVPFSPQL